MVSVPPPQSFDRASVKSRGRTVSVASVRLSLPLKPDDSNVHIKVNNHRFMQTWLISAEPVPAREKCPLITFGSAEYGVQRL